MNQFSSKNFRINSKSAVESSKEGWFRCFSRKRVSVRATVLRMAKAAPVTVDVVDTVVVPTTTMRTTATHTVHTTAVTVAAGMEEVTTTMVTEATATIMITHTIRTMDRSTSTTSITLMIVSRVVALYI